MAGVSFLFVLGGMMLIGVVIAVGVTVTVGNGGVGAVVIAIILVVTAWLPFSLFVARVNLQQTRELHKAFRRLNQAMPRSTESDD